MQDLKRPSFLSFGFAAAAFGFAASGLFSSSSPSGPSSMKAGMGAVGSMGAALLFQIALWALR